MIWTAPQKLTYANFSKRACVGPPAHARLYAFKILQNEDLHSF